MNSDVGVVLAHGAWADGSSWAKVIAGLRTFGVDAVAAPLPLTSLADDVTALDRAIARMPGKVVVAGHAYGGAVIGESRSDRVKALVYVAALAPDEGVTVAEIFYRNPPHPLAPKLAPDEHGLIWLPRTAFAAAFAQNASEEEQALLFAVQRPISPACITVAVRRPQWRDKPSWYALAEDDRMIVSETQEFMAERMQATIRRIRAADHTPSITSPTAVIETIMEAVRA